MTHPLKQRFNKLTSQELDALESVLMSVLHETGRHAQFLLSEEGLQQEDWGDDHAETTAWITILSKVFGVDPPTKWSKQRTGAAQSTLERPRCGGPDTLEGCSGTAPSV
jgi:hypothetical protein